MINIYQVHDYSIEFSLLLEHNTHSFGGIHNTLISQMKVILRWDVNRLFIICKLAINENLQGFDRLILLIRFLDNKMA